MGGEGRRSASATLEPGMSEPKVSPRLARTLEESHDEAIVELVIELEAPAPPTGPATLSAGDRIGALKSAFYSAVQPVERGIREAGGETVGHAWINQTVKARVPKAAVPALSGLETVRRLDLTDRIEPEEEE